MVASDPKHERYFTHYSNPFWGYAHRPPHTLAFAVGDKVAVIVGNLPLLTTITKKWQTGTLAGMLGDGSKHVLVQFRSERFPDELGALPRAIEMPVDALTHDLTPPWQRRILEY